MGGGFQEDKKNLQNFDLVLKNLQAVLMKT
jgi:hypothetical protein